MKKAIAAVLVAASGLAAPALANHGQRDAGVDERRHRLESRIEEGRHSGELTRHEYRRLRHEIHEYDRVAA